MIGAPGLGTASKLANTPRDVKRDAPGLKEKLEIALTRLRFNCNSEEAREYISSVKEIDQLIAAFSSDQNDGFAYKLPSNKRAITSIGKKYLESSDIAVTLTGNRPFIAGMQKVPSGNYLQFQIINEGDYFMIEIKI